MKRLVSVLILAAMASAAYCLGGDEPVCPEFRLGLGGLEKTTAGLPPTLRDGIMAAPARFLKLMARTLDEPQDLLVLVDKANGLGRDDVPADLVPLSSSPLTLWKKGLSLRAVVVPDLSDMSRAARAKGIDLPVSSAYRSYDYQSGLFKRALETQGRSEVERELALPGHSQHQLGTTIDFGTVERGFADTRAGKWLAANAWKFGFSLSYPKGGEAVTGYAYEPWHYRYVGRAAAEMIREFFGDSQQGFMLYYKEWRPFFEEKRLPRG